MTAEEVVRSYFACLDAEDWGTLRTLWNDDAEMRAVGARPRSGADAVVEYFSRVFAPWREHTDKPTRFITQGDTIVVEVTFTGTAQDGRVVNFDAVDVFDMVGGRIQRLTNWYDIAYARRVLAEIGAPSATDAGT
jgi:ketosteroid isomerase-like protein